MSKIILITGASSSRLCTVKLTSNGLLELPEEEFQNKLQLIDFERVNTGLLLKKWRI